MISIPVLQNDRHDAEPGITHMVKEQSPEHTPNKTKPVQGNAPEGFEEGAECEGFIPEKSVSQARPWHVNPAEGQAAKAALSPARSRAEGRAVHQSSKPRALCRHCPERWNAATSAFQSVQFQNIPFKVCWDARRTGCSTSAPEWFGAAPEQGSLCVFKNKSAFCKALQSLRWPWRTQKQTLSQSAAFYKQACLKQH